MFQLFNYGEVGLKSQHIIKNAGFFIRKEKEKNCMHSFSLCKKDISFLYSL